MKISNIIKSDIFRYYGETKKCIFSKLFYPIELKYIITFRKANYYKKSVPFGIYYYFKLKRLTRLTHIQIPIKTQVGKGLYIGHIGSLIINPNAVLGDNINLSTGITIGKSNRGEKKGYPTIGNNVWIGTNAVIVGNIQIGNNVLIAPNSYINFNVPDDSIVIGNPGVIHHNENATVNYINNIYT